MKQVLLVVMLVVVLPGCDFFSKSHPRQSEIWPVYKSIPAKPVLDIPATIVPNKNPELDIMIRNVYNLASYADSLKIIIDSHNTAAAAHNQRVEQDLGIGQPQK